MISPLQLPNIIHRISIDPIIHESAIILLPHRNEAMSQLVPEDDRTIERRGRDDAAVSH